MSTSQFNLHPLAFYLVGRQQGVVWAALAGTDSTRSSFTLVKCVVNGKGAISRCLSASCCTGQCHSENPFAGQCGFPELIMVKQTSMLTCHLQTHLPVSHRRNWTPPATPGEHLTRIMPMDRLAPRPETLLGQVSALGFLHHFLITDVSLPLLVSSV